MINTQTLQKSTNHNNSLNKNKTQNKLKCLQQQEMRHKENSSPIDFQMLIKYNQ